MKLITIICLLHATCIICMRDAFWRIYFTSKVYTGGVDWTPSFEFVSTAGAMFLTSYAFITEVVPTTSAIKNAHTLIWLMYLAFTVSFWNYTDLFFQCSNVTCCIMVFYSMKEWK